MTKPYRYVHLDVFTDVPFGGNQLAVFPDARGLSSSEMQQMTREMNFSECTFVLPREDPATDVRVRIFTPGREMPMAGHPTVGTAFALATEGVIAARSSHVVFGLNIGPTNVELDWRGDRLRFAWMTQQRPTFGSRLHDIASIAGALGVDDREITATSLPVEEVSCGVPFVFVPFATRAAVDDVVVDGPRLAKLAWQGGADGVFVFSAEPASGRGGEDAGTVYARMFAPGLGVPEDPATGAASGPLGCYLVRRGVVRKEEAGKIISIQGVKMGRPSRVHIAIGLDGDDITSVRVGGQAVVVGEGTLHV